MQLFSALARLRQDPAFKRGEILFSYSDDDIFSYVRQIPGSGNDVGRYLVVLNLGQGSSKRDYSVSPVGATKGVVVQGTCSVIGKVKDKEVELTDLELSPGDGLVIRLV